MHQTNHDQQSALCRKRLTSRDDLVAAAFLRNSLEQLHRAIVINRLLNLIHEIQYQGAAVEDYWPIHRFTAEYDHAFSCSSQRRLVQLLLSRALPY